MARTSGDRDSSAFSSWLRKGRLPPVLGPAGLELKFNPWHDPADGRFTFAGAGQHYGAGSSPPSPGDRPHAPGDPGRSRIATSARVEASRGGLPAGDGQNAGSNRPSRAKPSHAAGTRPVDAPDPVSEFFGGVGEGLYDVGKDGVAGVRAALTSNPATTISNAGRGIAGMIDAAIAAEDTPARIQVSRAASAVANASTRDIGRGTGTVVGNVALATAPGAALSRVATLRRLRKATPRTTFDPPQIVWVKEAQRPGKHWQAYNDSAAGARPGQAPTLTRTMPNGSKRPVKFDGIRGDYVIDRKLKVVNSARGRAQVLRQSQALSEHRLIGLWEVPSSVQKAAALKMFKRVNASNIHVGIVKP